jgi:hypothetical protein
MFVCRTGFNRRHVFCPCQHAIAVTVVLIEHFLDSLRGPGGTVFAMLNDGIFQLLQ